MVRKVSGVNFQVVEGPRRPGDPAALVAKADRIRNILDWLPCYDNLETIVADAWRWEHKLASAVK
jgi:UDP-glucose 4-epimerase